MQEKTSQNFTARLEALKLRKELSDERLADRVGLSRRMLYLIRTGKSSITRKTWYKLEQAEREAGIETPLKRLEDELVIRGEISTPLVELRQKDAKLAKLLDAAAPQIRAMSDSLGRFAARFDTVESKLDTVLTRLDALEKKPKK